MENFNIVKLFACTCKFNRSACNSLYRKCRTASSVTVKLCENNTRNVKKLVKALRNINCVLTCHRVDNKQNFVWFNFFFDVFKLIHKSLINMKSACGIKNNNIVAVVLCTLDCLFCNLNGICFSHFKNRNACLFTYNLQLVDSGGTIYVTGGKQRISALLFQHFCKLCRVGCFTRTLKTAHHDDCRRLRRKLNSCVLTAHKACKLLVNNLNNHLCRSKTLHNILTDSTLCYFVCKVLCNLVVYIGLKKCESNLSHCFLNIFFRKLAFVFQFFERIAKLICKSFKCHENSFNLSASLIFR